MYKITLHAMQHIAVESELVLYKCSTSLSERPRHQWKIFSVKTHRVIFVER